jgi:secondary thiamine-phosphate synthase enzyme
MGNFSVERRSLKLQTKTAPEFIDLTDNVTAFVTESGITEGTVTVYSKHTTGAIRINENETGIQKDFTDHLEKMLPRHKYYTHNDLTIRTENLECDDDVCAKNGHAHQQHFLLGTSETIPVAEGKLTLGRWQRIFFIELCSPRKREVVLQVMGLKK